MGVTMRVKKGIRHKGDGPRIVISQKVSLIKFKDKDGNCILKLANSRNVSNTAQTS